jgi:predicted GH43/DUF377 family glycosyl hydrolase
VKINFFISLFLIACCQTLFSQPIENQLNKESGIVKSITRIHIEGYPGAFNPSLIKTDKGLLLTFRWIPDPLRLWINYIGVVLLDPVLLRPLSRPQLLDTRIGNTSTPSQSEDARLFSYRGSVYIIYNDNNSFVNPSLAQRRDMFISELSYQNHQFVLSEPLKLYHQKRYATQKWQKNWIPFVWHDALLISYSLIPHEVLYTDLNSGECVPLVTTPFPNTKWSWKWGQWRGGTPALLVDDEYLAFFHSSLLTSSEFSNGVQMHHYYMGAYTFSSEPPFEITRITPSPIVADGFYTLSALPKRVVFPGGFVVADDRIYLAYGKDDEEVWIAILDKQQLKKALVPTPLLTEK